MISLWLILQTVVTVLTVLLVSVWCWYQWTHRRELALLRTLPTGLPTLPLLGHLHYVIPDLFKEDQTANLRRILSQPVPGTFVLWIGPIPFVNIKKIEDIKKFLTSSRTLEKSVEYKMISYMFGDGLLTAPVHLWKKTRKQISPIFHPPNLKYLVSDFNEKSQQLVHDLQDHIDKGQFDVLHHIFSHAYVNVFDTLCGSEVTIRNHPDYLIRALTVIPQVQRVLTKRLSSIWFHSDILFYFIYKTCIQEMVQFTKDAWEMFFSKAFEKRQKLLPILKPNDNDYENTDSLNKGLAKGRIRITDIFHNLQQSCPDLGEEYMHSELRTLLGTGSETIAVALSSCLMALGTHPHIEEKLYTEIIEIIGENEKDINSEMLSKLAYLDQVVKESLRRFTTVPVIMRRPIQDIQISDCTIPENTTVFIYIDGVHMNPDIYPDPNKFDPDHFSPENVAKRDKFAFLPFSGGIRDCVGKQYSMALMKIALIHIIREFVIYSEVDINNMSFYYSVTLSSIDGYTIELKKRNNL